MTEYIRRALAEPTDDQCAKNQRVIDTEDLVGYAMWYPQMGGYIAKAVVTFVPGNKAECFDAYVWHDGEFPFSEDDGMPAHIHHCNPEQFIRFGNTVKGLQEIETGKVV